MPGITYNLISKIGHRLTPNAEIIFDNARVPETKVMFPAVVLLSSAMDALLSELVMVTLGVAVLTTFQLASTALTTTALLMAVPAV